MSFSIGSIASTLNEEGLLERATFTMSGTYDDIQVSTEVVVEVVPQEPVEGDALLKIVEASQEYDRARYTLYNKAQIKRSAPRQLSLEEKKTLWMSQIDNNVAAVYTQFTRFQMEYEQREKAALAYRASGYTGDPTIWLTPFADSNGITYKDCADIVIAQAEKLRAAIVALGVLRMSKYNVKNAKTEDEAQLEFTEIINQVAELGRSLA